MKKHSEMVQRAWDLQKDENDEKKAREKAIEEERIKVEVEANLKKEMKMQEKEEERVHEVNRWKNIVLGQIEELKAKRLEEKRLNEMWARIEAEKAELEDVTRQQKMLEDRRKRIDFR